jgi:hypothetical protein
MDVMPGRVWKWGGAVLFVAVAIALGVYFGRVGLEEADRGASVVGAFVGLAGLALTVYGLMRDRRADAASPDTSASDARSSQVSAEGQVRNVISGGNIHGPVVQGRDFEGITFGTPTPPRTAPPAEENGETA